MRYKHLLRILVRRNLSEIMEGFQIILLLLSMARVCVRNRDRAYLNPSNFISGGRKGRWSDFANCYLTQSSQPIEWSNNVDNRVTLIISAVYRLSSSTTLMTRQWLTLPTSITRIHCILSISTGDACPYHKTANTSTWIWRVTLIELRISADTGV